MDMSIPVHLAVQSLLPTLHLKFPHKKRGVTIHSEVLFTTGIICAISSLNSLKQKIDFSILSLPVSSGNLTHIFQKEIRIWVSTESY